MARGSTGADPAVAVWTTRSGCAADQSPDCGLDPENPENQDDGGAENPWKPSSADNNDQPDRKPGDSCHKDCGHSNEVLLSHIGVGALENAVDGREWLTGRHDRPAAHQDSCERCPRHG